MKGVNHGANSYHFVHCASLAFREVAVLIRGAISYQTTSYENSED